MFIHAWTCLNLYQTLWTRRLQSKTPDIVVYAEFTWWCLISVNFFNTFKVLYQVYFVSSTMSSHLYWCLMCRVCKRVYFKYAQGVVIPLTSIADPLKEFEATDVNQNIFRFLIFIMWLKHQPQACKWFLTIRKHYPDFVEACISKLMTLWRNQKPPSFWHLIASHVNRVV